MIRGGIILHIIVCLDDDGGMLFNRRRQSRDSKVIDDIIQTIRDKNLYITKFSEALFKDRQINLHISEKPWENADKDDFCFIENADTGEFINEADAVTIYRCNKKYPADVYFNMSKLYSCFTLSETCEFNGSSHEVITKEVYRR